MPPIPPIIPDAYSAWLACRPRVSTTDPVFVEARCWSIYHSQIDAVQLDFTPPPWATLTQLRKTIDNDLQTYWVARLDNVAHGEHILTCDFTWPKRGISQETLRRTAPHTAIRPTVPRHSLHVVAFPPAGADAARFLLEHYRPGLPGSSQYDAYSTLEPAGESWPDINLPNTPALKLIRTLTGFDGTSQHWGNQTFWPEYSPDPEYHSTAAWDGNPLASRFVTHGYGVPIPAHVGDAIAINALAYNADRTYNEMLDVELIPERGNWQPELSQMPNRTAYTHIGWWHDLPQGVSSYTIRYRWANGALDEFDGDKWVFAAEE